MACAFVIRSPGWAPLYWKTMSVTAFMYGSLTGSIWKDVPWVFVVGICRVATPLRTFALSDGPPSAVTTGSQDEIVQPSQPVTVMVTVVMSAADAGERATPIAATVSRLAMAATARFMGPPGAYRETTDASGSPAAKRRICASTRASRTRQEGRACCRPHAG